MQKKDMYCIGLMSGTSLDGIDLVYLKINPSSYTNFEILEAETIPYSTEWKTKLQTAISFIKEELIELDITYGNLLGDVLHNFIDKYAIENIDFIASHGHTILHQPENGITLQIGDGQTIANKTKQKIVCDFRTQDVQLGGQGAPLVPIGDKLLFADYDYCLNLGGFANVSYEKENERIAFDICPVNIVLNYYCKQMNFEYDNEGKIASTGKINLNLLDKLNKQEFYQKNPPKSLGLEWVQQYIFPLIDDLESNIPSILRTFVEHSAMQIGKIIKGNSSVLVTGGGAFNTFLMQRIESYAQVKIELPNQRLINYKEALIFAFLGLLKIENQINCLQSVTGASKDHSSGKIFYPF